MVSLEIIEREEPAAGWLEDLKAYASVADDSQDSLLNALLVRACLRVQEMADKSILACTLEVHDDEVEDNYVRLYQSVSEIEMVTSQWCATRPSHAPQTLTTSCQWSTSMRPHSMTERIQQHSQTFSSNAFKTIT